MSPSKFSGVTLRDGDQVRILMPGGGGYGDPLRRDRERVRRDVARGVRQRRGGARRVYGLEEEAGPMGEWKQQRDQLPEGEPGRLRRSAGTRSPAATGRADVDGVERMFCSPDARAALPRLLAPPLRSEGGQPDAAHPVLSDGRAAARPAATRRRIRAGDFLFLSGQGPYDAAGDARRRDDRRAGAPGAREPRRRRARRRRLAAGRRARRHVHQRHARTSTRWTPSTGAFFADPMPARTTIQSDLVGFDVEGDAVVWLGG